MIAATIRRDVQLGARRPFGRVVAAAFVIAFLALTYFGLQDGDALPAILPGLVWSATIIAALFAAEPIFAEDLRDGTLGALMTASLSLWSYVTAKALAFALLSLLPIWIVIVLSAFALGQSATVVAGLSLSLLFAMPAITAFATLSGALLAGESGAAMLAVLLAVPLLIPVTIFGLSAGDGALYAGLSAPGFRALLGLDLIAVGTALPASVFALRAHLATQ